MRRWGVLVTAGYFVVLAGLILPGLHVINAFSGGWFDIYREWSAWLWMGMLVGGEALLLFLSVDTSHQRLRPRQHVLASIALTALLAALLACAGLASLWAAVFGDGSATGGTEGSGFEALVWILAWVLGLWGIWGVVFWWRLRRAAAGPLSVVPWLIKGSVLELLVAVPAHIIVRRRGDCSAPAATSFGIATGLAIMLLCFGPGIFFLFRDRFRRYPRRS